MNLTLKRKDFKDLDEKNKKPCLKYEKNIKIPSIKKEVGGKTSLDALNIKIKHEDQLNKYDLLNEKLVRNRKNLNLKKKEIEKLEEEFILLEEEFKESKLKLNLIEKEMENIFDQLYIPRIDMFLKPEKFFTANYDIFKNK